MRIAPAIVIEEHQRDLLQRWARGRRTPVRLMQRARIVLQAADGMTNQQIAQGLGIDAHTVARWRRRFLLKGIRGIEKDAPRGGRKPTKRNQVARAIVEKTTREKPANATHWSTRTLAKEMGVSASMVGRVWKANGLKPHLGKSFKVSNDPHFVDKVIDVVGLYLNPPEHGIVLCVDEKSQIQALDRTQKSLPMYPGRLGTLTHDYKRHGTTTLFAALNYLDGQLIGTCMPRHRHQEWIEFLKLIDQQTPSDADLHLIVDNYSTHKHANVKTWLNRHPRFHIHFTPTSCSWLNLVERWFRELTEKRIRRGVFTSVPNLIEAIDSYMADHNLNPKAFTWTAKAAEIIEKVQRARQVLNVQTG